MKFDLQEIAHMQTLNARLATRLQRHETHLRTKAASEIIAADEIATILKVTPVDGGAEVEIGKGA